MDDTTTSSDRASTFIRESLFIGGTWRPAEGRDRIPVTDPFTEKVIGSVPEANEDDADEAIRIAVEASRTNEWLNWTYRERGAAIARIADELDKRAEQLTDVYVHDLGGLRAFAPYVITSATTVLREHAVFGEMLSSEPEWRSNGGESTMILREPVGPVLAVVPWNGPLVLAVVKIAPALLAGCPVVVKVAPEDPLASFLLAEAIEAAGIPAGLVSFLPGRSSRMGNLPGRAEFRHIAFTGSTESGKRIMQSAAENITDVTLELGGKSAGIFLEDIDPEHGAQLVIPGSLAQSGQVCTTYSRLLVPESRAAEWIRALVLVFESLPIGDPSDSSTMIGPLVSAGDRERVESYIELIRAEGAQILAGGARPTGLETGYFIEPTLVGSVTNEMRIVREEVFGPVITVQSYRDVDEAVAMANDSEFGLAGGVFTNDIEAGIAVAKRIEAGSIGVNNFGACLVQPFGGYKKSGLGREGGIENVLALTETKQIRMPAALPL